ASLLAVALDIYEFFVPGAFSITPGRSAGLYLNSNTSAFALVFGMAITSPYLPGRLRILFHLTIGVGVFFTFSRGGLFCWGVTTACLQLFDVWKNKRSLLKSWVPALIVIAVLMISPIGEVFVD